MDGLYVNQVYRNVSTDERFRTVWVSPDRSVVYIYRLGIGKGFPTPESIESIEEGFEKGWLELEDEKPSPGVPSEEGRKRRDEIWAMIGEALVDEPAIFEKSRRSEILDGIAAKHGIDKTNLYPLLRKYWERGKTKDAFLPLGNGRSRKIVSNGKRGRKSRASERGIPLTDEDRENMDRAIKKYYLNRQELTLDEAYRQMLKDSYSVRTLRDDGTDQVTFLPEDQLPSFSQFRYRYSSQFRTTDVVRKRKGDREYGLNHTANLHHADWGMQGPGAEFQVDATIADIYLVSAFNRADLIGRPVVYFVIDSFSRIVTGMYIGLEGPSWVGMMMALYNACTDKVSYCRSFDIEISEDQWPCHHVPDRYVGDRGELLSHKADVLAESLDVRIDNAPPYRGDLKPFVERFFKTADGKTSVLIPGKVKPDMKERGGHDYRLDAQLTLREFTRIMIRIVIDYNQHKVLNCYEPTEQMVRSDIDVIPLQIWNWGIRNCSGRLRVVPEECVRLALMPREVGSITDKGVRFKKLFYTCREFEKLELFARAREEGTEKVSVSYDPRDVSRIYVWREGEEKACLCRLLEWEDKYCGKSEDETEYEMLRQEVRKNAVKREEQEAQCNLDEFVRREVDNAKAAFEASVPDMAKSERLKGMKENRARARQEAGGREAFTGDSYCNEPERRNDAPDSGGGKAPDGAEGMSPAMKKLRARLDARMRETVRDGGSGEAGD